MEMSGQNHAPAAEPLGKGPGTNWIGVLLSPRACTDFRRREKKVLLLPYSDPNCLMPFTISHPSPFLP